MAMPLSRSSRPGLAGRRRGRRLAATAVSAVLVLGGCSSAPSSAGSSTSAPASTTAGPATSPAGPASAAPGSGTKAPSPRDLLPQNVIDRGYVTVATTFGFPPEQFNDESGKPIGSTIDLGEALGAKLGIEFKQVDAPWDGVIAGLKAHRYDVVIGGMIILPERRKQLNFVRYKRTGQGMIIHADNAATLKQWPDFCGKKVGNLKGSTNGDTVAAASKENCEAKGKPAIELVPFNGASDVYQAIIAKRIDGTLSGLAAVTYMADHSDGKMKVDQDIVKMRDDSGIATPPDDGGLGKAIAAALQELIDDGTYARILTKWGQGGDQLLDKTEYLPVQNG